eukprot:3874789-Rhodomonas_salina.1
MTHSACPAQRRILGPVLKLCLLHCSSSHTAFSARVVLVSVSDTGCKTMSISIFICPVLTATWIFVGRGGLLLRQLHAGDLQSPPANTRTRLVLHGVSRPWRVSSWESGTAVCDASGRPALIIVTCFAGAEIRRRRRVYRRAPPELSGRGRHGGPIPPETLIPVLRVLRALRVQGPGFIPSVVDVDVVVDVVVDVAGQKILLRVVRAKALGFQTQYNEENKVGKLELVLFEYALEHLLRISRCMCQVLVYPEMGVDRSDLPRKESVFGLRMPSSTCSASPAAFARY